MNSTFWAINAAKKKRVDLVPGTSRWIANELYLINSDVLTCSENDFQEVSDGLDQMNYFIQKALEVQHDNGSRISFLRQLDEKAARNNTPTNFSYISPVKVSMMDGFGHSKPQPQSSPIRRREKQNSNHKQVLNPKTPSPLKNVSAIGRTDRESEPQSGPFIDKKEYTETKEINDDNDNNANFLAPSLDDSFQAISTAIRKSIAGKSAPDSHNITDASGMQSSIIGFELKTNKPENNSAIDESKNTTLMSEKNTKDIAAIANTSTSRENIRKSEYKTPKRSSIFVSLPSREPIAISSTTKPRQSIKAVKYSGPKSNSSRVFERLDIASRRDNSNTTGNSETYRANSSDKDTENVSSTKTIIQNHKNVYMPEKKLSDKLGQVTKIETTSLIEQPSNSNNTLDDIGNEAKNINDKKQISNLMTYTDKEMDMKNTIDFSKTPKRNINGIHRINSIDSVLRRARNALQNTANKIDNIQDKVQRDMLMKPKTYDQKIVQKTPLRSSDSPSRSRSRSPQNTKPNERKVRRSPIKDNKLSSDRKNTLRGSESDLINRLMTPTGSSAAKSTKITTSHKTTNNIPSRIPETQKKNRFLTTTLNYNNVNLNGNKNQSLKTVQSLTKLQTSPIKKRNAGTGDEQETRIPLKLESLTIPNLKKKSLMAERSEAAAQKPKQKLVITVNHKYDLKGKSKGDTPLKRKNTDIENNVNQSDERRNRNEYQSPEHHIMNISRPNEKRLKSVNLPHEDQNFNNDQSNKRRKTLKDNKPNHTNNSHNTFDRKTLQTSYDKINADKTYKDVESPDNYKTPTRSIRESNYLPDIESDDDDNNTNKEKRILRSWANTPELHKLVMQNRTINPVSIFGEVPKLNINEVFESQISRYRGEQSPLQWSPKDKKRKKEERDYAIQMGYIK